LSWVEPSWERHKPWWSKPLSNVHARTNYPGRLYRDSVASTVVWQ